MNFFSRVGSVGVISFFLSMAPPASADFFDNFDGGGYVAGAGLPAPWTGGFQFNNLMPVSAIPSGFGNTQGTHGPAGSWMDADRLSNYDTNQLVHELSWKARLSTANGLARLNVGAGNALGGHLIFEMNAANDKIEWSGAGTTVGTVNVIQGDWYQMLVTLTNDGADNWSWVGQYAHFNGATFDAALPMGSGTLNAGYAPQSVNLQSIYAFPEDNGTSAIDDVGFSVVPEPSAIVSVCLGLAAFAGLRFRQRLRLP